MDGASCHRRARSSHGIARSPDGKTLLGTSRIDSILAGCVILENWAGSGGGDGKSFNIWTRSDSLWHQTWVSSLGALLNLSGSFHDGKMVLEGPASSRQPPGVRNRISYAPQANGEMEQRWDLSADGGATWKTLFVGIYRKAK